MYRRIILAILIGSVAACGDDESTSGPTEPTAATQSVTVALDYVEVLGACEGVATNPGDFDYTINVFDETGRLSLTTSPSSLIHGLPGDRFEPPTTTHTMELVAEEGNAFKVQLRGTEFDNAVPDSRFDDRGTTQNHSYQGGQNWNNGSNIVRVIGGEGVNPPECGLDLGYSVTVG